LSRSAKSSVSTSLGVLRRRSSSRLSLQNSAMQALNPEVFQTLPDLIAIHAQEQPNGVAVRVGDAQCTYDDLYVRMCAVARALLGAGVQPQETVAVCAATSVAYAAVYLGALRAGIAIAPLPPSATAEQLRRMVQDAGAKFVFADAEGALLLAGIDVVRLDLADGAGSMAQWLQAGDSFSDAWPRIEPAWPFNIIYSSGTTGDPKGIVQSHGMRWGHILRGLQYAYGPGKVSLFATPLYSNTTLVTFIPTLAYGGCAVLMPKFDALGYLQLAAQVRATHTMLVPVQYQRIMVRPEFSGFDLSCYEVKFCTSAPFHPELKADVLKRWPGGLIEFYGMTEGGGSCILEAHKFPDKLHTVGRPAAGSDIRLLDDAGRDHKAAECGELVGEIIGASGSMMTGYHGRPDKTREAEWFDATGKRFIRTGDVGRFDADGFLTLMDRKKDMIISGGYNIYPSDLEALLRQHSQVQDVAVVGMPSMAWGETPVAFVVAKEGFLTRSWPSELMTWANAQLGKTQRLAAVQRVAELPRSAIGKILKRELRDSFRGQVA
jgi:long-chain acyl-CoA synthetase